MNEYVTSDTLQIGLKWSVIPTDSIGKSILSGSNWEPHLMLFMERFLRYGDTAIDVGACFGWHTLQMARIVGNTGKVYAFEPQKINYELLQKNITNNSFNNITSFNLALGHKTMESCICTSYFMGQTNFGDGFISPDMENSNALSEEYIGRIGHLGQSTILPLNKETVKCVMLDDMNIQENVKFIKIDVQGFERMVLQGGVKLISKNRPVMVIEVENPCLAQFGYSSTELFETIRNLGYYIFLLDYEYPCDHVCVPTETLKNFEDIFRGKIYPHNQNNSLTNNVENGIDRKISLF